MRPSRFVGSSGRRGARVGSRLSRHDDKRRQLRRTMMLGLAELELDRTRENWRVAREHAVARAFTSPGRRSSATSVARTEGSSRTRRRPRSSASCSVAARPVRSGARSPAGSTRSPSRGRRLDRAVDPIARAFADVPRRRSLGRHREPRGAQAARASLSVGSRSGESPPVESSAESRSRRSSRDSSAARPAVT